MTKVAKVLNLPQAERVRFERNTIRQVFCELRFPTLPDLEKSLPRNFLKKIGKEYPGYEHGMGLKIGITDKGMEQIPQGTHRLHTRKRDRTIWVRTSSFGVETREYLDFETFHKQITTVMEGLTPCLDTDFFTRVGLRYLNIIPTDPGDINGWVNEVLLGPLATDVLGEVVQHWCETRGQTALGGYTLRHGVSGIEGEGRRYILDTDFFSEGVEVDDVSTHLLTFNDLNFALFNWAIGDKCREWLGSGTPKKGK
jgi:uncharacterized protein (TIGR04255 family)